MAKKPKANPAVEAETKPADVGQDTPAAEPVNARNGDTLEESLDDARRRGIKAVVCMPVIYRDEREHNGQTDLAAVITGLPGDDAHGATLAHLYVTPPLGTPFPITAPQWDGDEDEQPARTWRFCF